MSWHTLALGAAGMAILALLIVVIVLWRARRSGYDGAATGLGARIDAHAQGQAAAVRQLEQALRSEIADTARAGRTEAGAGFVQFQQALLNQLRTMAELQNSRIESFGEQLGKLVQSNAAQMEALRADARQQAQHARDEQAAVLQRFSETLTQQFAQLQAGNDRRFAEVRATIEQKLKDIENNNAVKLDEMRRTVDEKLHATLEQRLGESFRQVSERLEQVHRGLGEMQNLAAGVGDLKKVLTNVKSRGTWGEVQLEALLEQMLTIDQYAKNVATVPRSLERVEFAIRLPGRAHAGNASQTGNAGHADDQCVWLPIDAKFPREDYERLIDAQERGDVLAADEASRALEIRIRIEAKAIADKYVYPPHTTDFALLFLPTEGLYAEVLRRPGLADALQRDYRISLAGPTTLSALLNSLQMGFRTLAIERRSSEVWQVLGAVKTEFGKFGDVLSRTKNQLETVTRSIEAAEVRTRAMSRKLRDVEALPGEQALGLLGGEAAATAGELD